MAVTRSVITPSAPRRHPIPTAVATVIGNRHTLLLIGNICLTGDDVTVMDNEVYPGTDVP